MGDGAVRIDVTVFTDFPIRLANLLLPPFVTMLLLLLLLLLFLGELMVVVVVFSFTSELFI